MYTLEKTIVSKYKNLLQRNSLWLDGKNNINSNVSIYTISTITVF